jgi:hypothetical protein
MINVDYIDTWKEVILNPSDFYKEMPKAGGYFYPIIFAIVSNAISVFVSLIFTPDIGDFGESTYLVPLIVAMIPIITTFGLFINVTILHIIYKALGGKGTYEGTARFILYSSAASLFISVPLIGWIFGIYQFYLYIVGGKFIHKMSMGRSLAAFILFILLVLAFTVVIALSGLVPERPTIL